MRATTARCTCLCCKPWHDAKPCHPHPGAAGHLLCGHSGVPCRTAGGSPGVSLCEPVRELSAPFATQCVLFTLFNRLTLKVKETNPDDPIRMLQGAVFRVIREQISNSGMTPPARWWDLNVSPVTKLSPGHIVSGACATHHLREGPLRCTLVNSGGFNPFHPFSHCRFGRVRSHLVGGIYWLLWLVGLFL